MLPNKTTTNDFNLPVAFRLFPHKGLADEYRANCFFPNHGPAPSLGFPQMCQTISWRPQNTKILLHGPISLYGIRSINLPREFARHRSMPARQSAKTLSHGHSIFGGPYVNEPGSGWVLSIEKIGHCISRIKKCFCVIQETNPIGFFISCREKVAWFTEIL